MAAIQQLMMGLSPTVFTSYQPSFTAFSGSMNVPRTQVVDSTYLSNTQSDLQLVNGSYFVFSSVASGTSLPAVLTAFVTWLNDTVGQIRTHYNNTDRWDDAGLNKLSSSGVGLSYPRQNPGTTYQLFSLSDSTAYSGYTFNYSLTAVYNATTFKYTFRQTFGIIGAGFPYTYANTIPTTAVTINGIVQYMMPNNIGGTLPTITQASFPITLTSAKYWRLYPNAVSWAYPALTTLPYRHIVYTASMYSTADATGTDLALAATSVASTDAAGLNGLRAHDGNLVTYWETTGAGVQYLRYTFSSAVAIRSLKFRFHTSGYHAESYKLQYSSDAVNWTDLVIFGTSKQLANQSYLSLQ